MNILKSKQIDKEQLYVAKCKRRECRAVFTYTWYSSEIDHDLFGQERYVMKCPNCGQYVWTYRKKKYKPKK